MLKNDQLNRLSKCILKGTRLDIIVKMYSNPYFTYMYHNISVGIVGGSPQKIYPQESLFVAKNTIIIRILV